MPGLHQALRALFFPLLLSLSTLGTISCQSGQPDQAGLAELRAQNALDQGRADFARSFFKEARAIKHDPALLRAEGLAWLTGFHQSLTEGSALLEEYLLIEPGDTEVRTRLATALALLGKDQRAADLLGDERCVSCTLSLAQVIVDRFPERAIELLGSSSSEPFDESDWTAPALLVQARASMALDQPEALTWCERALAKNPLHIETWYFLARQATARGQSELANKAFSIQRELRVLLGDGTLGPATPQQVLDSAGTLASLLDPPPWQLSRLMVPALAELGHTEQLRSTITELWSEDLSLTIRAELATHAGDAGLRRLAKDLFKDLLQRHPSNQGVRASLALLAIEENHLEEAEEILLKGLNEHPNFARYHFLFGRLHGQADRLTLAETSFRRALELAPWEASWRIELARLLRSQGQQEWRDLIQQAPESPPVLQQFRRQAGLPEPRSLRARNRIVRADD